MDLIIKEFSFCPFFSTDPKAPAGFINLTLGTPEKDILELHSIAARVGRYDEVDAISISEPAKKTDRSYAYYFVLKDPELKKQIKKLALREMQVKGFLTFFEEKI